MRAAAWMPLVAYIAALVLGPALHERHHATHGADHQHFATGTAYELAPHTHDDTILIADRTLVDEHERFDSDLALLDLAEVAEAGTLSVDCALAAYTLALCATDEGHAHRFGDQMAPSSPRRTAPDPEHHRFAIEHLAVSALVAIAPELAPAPTLLEATPPPVDMATPPSPRPLRSRSRAPPIV